MCIKLDACLSGQRFNISKSGHKSAASELAPEVGESECTSSLTAVSQTATVLWVSGHEPSWFSKLDVFGSHLSNVSLKSRDA